MPSCNLFLECVDIIVGFISFAESSLFRSMQATDELGTSRTKNRLFPSPTLTASNETDQAQSVQRPSQKITEWCMTNVSFNGTGRRCRTGTNNTTTTENTKTGGERRKLIYHELSPTASCVGWGRALQIFTIQSERTIEMTSSRRNDI